MDSQILSLDLYLAPEQSLLILFQLILTPGTKFAKEIVTDGSDMNISTHWQTSSRPIGSEIATRWR